MQLETKQMNKQTKAMAEVFVLEKRRLSNGGMVGERDFLKD